MLEGRNFWELVEKRAARTPDDVMTVDEDDRAITFGGYREAVLRAAAGLAARGIGEGDVVSWMLPTWHESLILLGALARLGATQNPIIPIYRDREVGFVTEQAGTKLLIVPGEWRGFDYVAMAERIKAERGTGFDVLTVNRDLPDADPATLPPAPPFPATRADEAINLLFYTSGTTADPKGARHSEGDIIVTARGMCDCLTCVEGDRNLMAFPVTHIAGPIWLCSSLMYGLTNVITEGFNPTETPALASRADVTMAGSATFFHMAYLEAQRAAGDQKIFPSLRNCPGGGAPKPPQLHRDVRDELGGVGIGVEGELQAQAPQLMRGYLDASLDADAFVDGWFRTGDLGVIDEQGYVRITGRLKDVIIRKGENVSAKEVEDLLFEHEKVADVAVIGLPDADRGELVCAVIAVKAGADELAFVEMQEYLRGRGLRVQALPERLEHLPEIPRNPSGKIQKKELQQQFGKP